MRNKVFCFYSIMTNNYILTIDVTKIYTKKKKFQYIKKILKSYFSLMT